MGKLLLAVATLAFAACQPMYGAPPQKLKTPSRVPPPVGYKDDDKGPVFVDATDDCSLRTTPVVGKPRRDTPRSDALVQKADQTAVAADKSTVGTEKGNLLIDSITDYGAALQKDPYNAEATLKLALAYDKVYRKQCAISMLTRLNKLASNPTYERAANEKLDDLEHHKSWFSRYRNDALHAAGR